MTKLAFIFFHDHEPLWVKVLQSKYFRTTPDGFSPRHLSSQSTVWKGITAEWGTMLRGSRATVRNGINTNFWSTIWVDGGVKLLDFACEDPSELNLQESVADFAVDSSDFWNASRGDDGWAWGSEMNGKFKIKSACALIMNEDQNMTPPNELWRKVWSRRGRIRHFLWIVRQDKLLTNDQRTKRKLSNDPHCPICPGVVENSVHVLRECSFAADVWKDFVQFDKSDSSWTDSLGMWLSHNVNSTNSLTFGIICWSLWKARNARIFSNNTDSTKSIGMRAGSWAGVVSNALKRNERLLGPRADRRTVEIAWDPGPSGWSTVNTDGAVDVSSGKAAAGGLIRDEFGYCLSAFTMNLSCCSITRAELRGALTGLRTAWERGFRKVELQVDSTAVVALFNEEGVPNHQNAMEVMDFQDLLKRDWTVRIRHVFREGNRAADFLASLGFALPVGSHTIPTSDISLGYHLRYDCSDVSELRSIPVNE
ncbi:Putative ribonuclease H protein At1g65750 [Linum perenne]